MSKPKKKFTKICKRLGVKLKNIKKAWDLLIKIKRKTRHSRLGFLNFKYLDEYDKWRFIHLWAARGVEVTPAELDEYIDLVISVFNLVEKLD